ncbi:hypothetical protein ACH5RR_019774 [Cinchona calisaya]|uniref:Protein kinase domain-containing protein n=1 Tax=Cinchona calisaya TaxID=153742 RepID=A0ABD2ZTX4_9GENT
MMNNFQDKLGVGVYGTVYKGKLRSGPPVAIKMMDKSMENAQEFPSLVAALGSLHHVNLMQLIGFYSEGMKRALVYDFMPNGSLQKYISTRELGESVCVSLSYKNLYEISLGVARGIDYLHQSSFGNQTSHFGIKSHNILLDENLIPKIADFGLSKLYPKVSYAAPEFYYKSIGDVSHKADVYSFGMLLMEMISCRTDIQNIGNDQLLAGKDIEIEDATEEERKMIKKMIKVALGCIQMKPADRPSMRKVLEILEDDDAELLEMPPKPSIVSQEIGQYHQE